MTSNSGVGTYSYPLSGSPRPHAVTAAGTWSYTYDANGNMKTGAGRTFTYNGENRPTAIDSQTYVYGPDGERWKTIDTTLGTETVYLGGAVEITGGVMTKYLPGGAKRVGSPGDPLIETFWLHHDHQGSLQAITDATGAEVQRFRYDPYGDRLATATAHAETKGWIGERQDATGLFYLHARYYDPVIGRFASADPSDPLAPGVGLNRYAYAGNNPVMRVDPWGLAASVNTVHSGLPDSSGYSGEYYNNDDDDDTWRPGDQVWHDAAIVVVDPVTGQVVDTVGGWVDPTYTPGFPDNEGDEGRPPPPAQVAAPNTLAQDLFYTAAEIALGFVPGSGLYDAYLSYQAGNYALAAGLVLTEFPGLKQIRAIFRTFRAITRLVKRYRANTRLSLVADVFRNGPPISTQKQARHLPGTREHVERVRTTGGASTFFGKESADRLTRDAYLHGDRVPGTSDIYEHEFGVSVGTGPRGGMQTRVRAHLDSAGQLHGHPSGPQRF